MEQGIGGAVKATKGGVIIDIEVQPGSRNPGKLSFDRWRLRLKLSVGERAQKGLANEEVLSTLAGFLCVGATDISLASGHTARKKSILVIGLELAEVCLRLSKAMEAER